ncbi:hypothetical protein CVV65_05680 [Kyrpidia spormannii]|uniref:DUF4829 domain-containing protein n=1 Tax=Kyrpidia spormannii TaxID=2055160 RepID=A0A2K8N5A4_9BACL|nr:hypothetical protein [Kyrpidia spormannii]ATY84508.1 hypothetical protein CVV65_05680 [Kyrpidia spormannii]
MKKLGFIVAAMVAAVTLSGCSVPFIHKQAEPQLSEQDRAADVVRKFVDAWNSATYKDPKSFTMQDQYLVPGLAKILDENSAHRNQVLVEHRGYLTHGPITVNFIKKDGNSYLFDAKTEVAVNSDMDGKDQNPKTFDAIFTVTKQLDGKFLIDNMQDPSQFQKK